MDEENSITHNNNHTEGGELSQHRDPRWEYVERRSEEPARTNSGRSLFFITLTIGFSIAVVRWR